MSHIQYVDELVKEYLLFRGFSQTLKAFDIDLKAEKEKGFRVSIKHSFNIVLSTWFNHFCVLAAYLFINLFILVIN